MSEQLGTVKNIKIPYPVEGVVRTAQLDDTISPEDSVQLAVNMNFDRVGAVQTRLGVASYADSLVQLIKNYGTLRNSIIPDGYERIAQIGDWKEISAPFANPSAVKMSDTEIVIFWTGTDNDGFARVYTIDQDTGSIEASGTLLEFEASTNSENCAIRVSSTRVLNVWTGPSNDGYVQCFQVAGGSITGMGSAVEFDTSNGQEFTLAQVDADHYICFYQGASSVGSATIFAIDGGGTVTEPGSTLTFDATFAQDNSCQPIGNGTHFINVWTGTSGLVQCFSVNTGTWAITAIGSPLSYEASAVKANLMTVGDGEHFVNIFSATGYQAQVFEVNTGTYAVTEVGMGVTLSAEGGNDLEAVAMGDGEHFVAFYSRNVGQGFVQFLEMDPMTFDMSLVGARISGYSFGGDQSISAINLSNFQIMTVWGTDEGVDQGYGVMFKTLGTPVDGKFLYAAIEDEVYNRTTGAWTLRRSGLAEVSKPRFDQYLNYIWMVNGNANIGGDPVATSNGGAFGSDLIPENFPPGDFIQAGFEGRVWVIDKTLGVIYYTDIVQFIPPDIYELTYNPEVNFIANLAPQTGQSFTAMYTVPRALLVFTEDSIYRIYGATSIDAYPAYNVGTFSQESIIETKTGIFFHHSSGFYQFDYGSQPVEISRRVIDFVKAIPRANYDDITGVYDGFDAIEWSVGTVVVEGVVFSNCVMRYTLSTQVWTIYDYPNNTITAMIFFDDGTNLNHLMGTSVGLTGAMDSGYTDFGQPFYFEYIDRWRSFTEMYYLQKSIGGFNVYSENAAGANLMYQIQKSGPNAWKSLGTITELNNALLPNSSTDDFDVLRLRIAGNTRGVPVVIHGIEITELTIKGTDQN